MTSHSHSLPNPRLSVFNRIDRVFLASLVMLGVVTLINPAQLIPSIIFTGESLLSISPFLALSVAMAAAAKASNADAAIARVFTGNPVRMISMAALFGALSPFCSCGVIPVIAGLLAAGVPLAPVMAFWISSPIMDPEMFILSTASLGLSFTVAKTLAAIGIGLMAGFATHFALAAGMFVDPLRGAALGCGTSSCSSSDDSIHWKFWKQPERRSTFLNASRETGWFLTKWLTIAFIIESQMTVYIPSSLITDWLGGGYWWTIPASVFASIPAYLNGYAAIPLMARLMDMGMAPGAAMGFLLGGGITCIPAAIAVFVLVRRAVFGWYLLLATTGAMLSATIYQLSI
ncbi:MAG: permease [Rhodospirillales bacterium]|jgi:uncharacterized protein|nr:permease [Rhodospirillales bacterium]